MKVMKVCMFFFSVCLRTVMACGVIVLSLLSPCEGGVPDEYRFWCVGDSITEGGASFKSYPERLAELLMADGFRVRFVGSKSKNTRMGTLAHDGYGGKNAEFLQTIVEQQAAKLVPDVVLIHAGHNHDSAEKPVSGIVAATQAMIRSCRSANPKVMIFLALPITSKKLPKYAYLPELHQALRDLAARSNDELSPVILVDQAANFSPLSDTIDDRVHPNPQGTEKMAQCWRQALLAHLSPQDQPYAPKLYSYRAGDGSDLNLHAFLPNSTSKAAPRTALIYFFGGGWVNGTPLQFYRECRAWSEQGKVAISADYRIAFTHPGSTPLDAIRDAKAAIRWLRAHAGELNIDPHRIVAVGASAGGHLAAAAAAIAFDGGSVKADEKPDALMLYYPVLDNSPSAYSNRAFLENYRDISPYHHLSDSFPPTLIISGSEDKLAKATMLMDAQQQLEKLGVNCQLEIIPGGLHPLFSYREIPQGKALEIRNRIDQRSRAFLQRLGW